MLCRHSDSDHSYGWSAGVIETWVSMGHCGLCSLYSKWVHSRHLLDTLSHGARRCPAIFLMRTGSHDELRITVRYRDLHVR